MKSVFRKIIFWIHLVFGVVSGLFIAILCLTGAALAFEKEVISFAERDAIRVEMPSTDAQPLPIDDLLVSVKKQLDTEQAESLSAIEAQSDPTLAWKASLGRRDFRYFDPYTGELQESPATATREFFRTMMAWHRWLTSDRENREVGKAITGVANLAFIGLGITGLYLWFPKVWKWRIFRSILFLKTSASGKARDFNWHNVFGFWALIPILIMAVTGTVFSYGWSRDLFRETLGSNPSREPLEPTVVVEASRRGPPLSLQERFEIAQTWNQDWESISLPTSTRAGRGGQRGRSGNGGGNHSHGGERGQQTASTASSGEQGGRSGGHNQGAGQTSENRGQGSRGNANASISPTSVRIAGDWFPLSPSRILIHPRTGEIIAEDRSAEWPLNAKLAASIRALHTGEAGLLPGKIIAFLGCLAGVVLVYTGFALTWRRLFKKGNKRSKPMAVKAKPEPVRELEGVR